MHSKKCNIKLFDKNNLNMSRTKNKKQLSNTSISSCDITLQKNLDELDEFIKITFPDENNIKHFHVRITPEQGIWKDGIFDFSFTIDEEWPIKPPTVRSITRIWHPNIAEDGEVCLSMLKENYSPTISIGNLIAGLQFLFCEPNAQSPLNNEAALQLRQNPQAFEAKVKDYIRQYCPKP